MPLPAVEDIRCQGQRSVHEPSWERRGAEDTSDGLDLTPKSRADPTGTKRHPRYPPLRWRLPPSDNALQKLSSGVFSVCKLTTRAESLLQPAVPPNRLIFQANSESLPSCLSLTIGGSIGHAWVLGQHWGASQVERRVPKVRGSGERLAIASTHRRLSQEDG